MVFEGKEDGLKVFFGRVAFALTQKSQFLPGSHPHAQLSGDITLDGFSLLFYALRDQEEELQSPWALNKSPERSNRPFLSQQQVQPLGILCNYFCTCLNSPLIRSMPG